MALAVICGYSFGCGFNLWLRLLIVVVAVAVVCGCGWWHQGGGDGASDEPHHYNLYRLLVAVIVTVSLYYA